MVNITNQLQLQLHFGLQKLQVTVLEKVTVKITNLLQLQLHFGLQKLQVNYSYSDST